MQPLASYFTMYGEAQQDLHSDARPDGYVVMSVAENNVSAPQVAGQIQHIATSLCSTKVVGEEKDFTMYDSWGGRRSLRHAFAALAERKISHGAKVDPSRLHVTSGCGAAIEHLGFLLMDHGDCVLLPTPSYGALWNDFCVRADVSIVEVPMDLKRCKPTNLAGKPQDGVITREMLEQAANSAVAQGLRPRCVFLINPNNPLGTLYSENDIRAVLDWAKDWRPRDCSSSRQSIHVIVDEVYALSMHSDESSAHFVSVTSIAAADNNKDSKYLGDFVHVLWGFSKDFCLGGARTGILLTHNDHILQALGNVGYFSSVCSMTQDILATLISNVEWVDKFVHANQKILRKGYENVVTELQRAAIPFVEACGGMFVWIDLRRCLRPSLHKWEAERELTARLFNEAKLLLTPGEATHHNEPGWYRCCYAWPKSESLAVGLRRLSRFYASTNSNSKL